MKKKIFFIRATLLIISIIVGLLISELIARKNLKIKYFTFEGVYSGYDDELVQGAKSFDSVLGYKPGSGWKKDGLFGFQNGKEYDNIKDEAIDIVLLGDSIIQRRDLEKAFKYVLKDKNYRIWNAGIGGYNTLQEAYYLEKYIELIPDILILGFCENDFFPSMAIVSNKKFPKGKFAQRLFEPLEYVNPFLFKHSVLYRYFKIKGINLANENEICSSETLINNRHVIVEGMKKIYKYCIRHSVSFFVIIYPHFNSDSLPEWQKESRHVVLEILNEYSINYIDLLDIYKDYGMGKLFINPPADDVHPNKKGHFIAAKEFIRKFYSKLGISKGTADTITHISYDQYKISYKE